MGGFVVVPQEPGPALAGAVFRDIPLSGFLTDGDDTLIGAWTTDFWVFGGAGDDLLVMNYTGQAYRLELDANTGFVGVYDADRGFVAFGTAGDFERFVLTGGDLDDTITGGRDGASTLAGGDGADLITLAGGGNFARGGSGNDSIYGATLSDTVWGGTGVDTLFVDLSGADGPVSLRGGTDFGTWTGIEHFAGTLTAFDDTLQGGALVWDADGGDGEDALILSYAALDIRDPGTAVRLDVVFDGFAWLEVVRPGEFSGAITFSDFERYAITGTAQGDTLRGGSGDDLFNGQAGDDSIHGGGGADTLIGGTGNDNLTGNLDAGSRIAGGAGDDLIQVWRADDTVSGGSGFDRLQLDLWDLATSVQIDLVAGSQAWAGIEAINGGLTRLDDSFRTTVVTGNLSGEGGTDLLAFDYRQSGVDGIDFVFSQLTVLKDRVAEVLTVWAFERFDLRGSAGGDRLQGEMMDDTLSGYLGDDTLDGDYGDDVLNGHLGADLLSGGWGDDTLSGGANDDTLSGGDGNDVLSGDRGADVLDGDFGLDMLVGGAGRDSLTGGWDADTLSGDGGRDTLSGGDDDDVLTGGAGNDVLTGGAGADRFEFHTGGDLGADRITDFDLALDRLVFNDEATFADLTVTQARAGARIVWDGGSVLLEGIDAADVTDAILL